MPHSSCFFLPWPLSLPVRAATVLYVKRTGDTLFLVNPATHGMSILRILLNTIGHWLVFMQSLLRSLACLHNCIQ